MGSQDPVPGAMAGEGSAPFATPSGRDPGGRAANTQPSNTQPRDTQPRDKQGGGSRGGGRGRPLSAETERAILQATTELLAERGLAATTIEEVAARARVGKASVYRRWTSKGTLAFDAFVADFLDRQPAPDTGNLRDDLLGLLRNWVRAVRQPTTGRTLKGLIAEVQRDPDLAEAWRDGFVGRLRATHLLVVQRAIDRGELAPEANTGLLLDLVYGPAYHRLLHGHLPLNDAFVEDLVAAIIAAVEAGAI